MAKKTKQQELYHWARRLKARQKRLGRKASYRNIAAALKPPVTYQTIYLLLNHKRSTITDTYREDMLQKIEDHLDSLSN